MVYVKTTVLLREDVYQALKKVAGKKKMSEKINEILYNALIGEKKSLFGTMKPVDVSDLRDHKDRL